MGRRGISISAVGGAALAALAVMSGSGSTALADAPTHTLTLHSRTYSKTDCGAGGCVPACMIQATLKNLGSTSPPLSIDFWKASKGSRRATAGVSFYFPGLKKGQRSTTGDDAAGVTCEHLRLGRVDVTCPEAVGERCPGFYYIEIRSYLALGVRHQKVEAR